MPSYPGWFADANPSEAWQERSVLHNLYLEVNGETPAIRQVPGFRVFATVSQAPIRTLFGTQGRVFFIAGYAFWELLADGTTTQRGTVDADLHPATIHANGDAGDQLGITSGGTFYNYDLNTNTLTAVGTPGSVATMGASIDGRFLSLDATTGRLYASALYDGTTWDPLHYQQSQAGDPWRAMCVTPDRLIRLFGETTGEVMTDQGLPGFPFGAVPEGNIPYGIAAPFAFTVDTSVTWLTQSRKGRGQIVTAQGYTPQRVSNHGIEYTIQRYDTIADCVAMSYQAQGHTFAIFTFPDEDATWVIDGATGKWHSRGSWDPATATAKAFRPGCALSAFDLLLVGDRETGTIYEMSTEYFSDVDGAVMPRIRQPPALQAGRARVILDSLELVMDVGIGLNDGQGRDPQAMLQISRDSGLTFGAEHWTSLGPMGQYRTRVIFSRLGSARAFVPRLTISDPVPVRIADALIALRGAA